MSPATTSTLLKPSKNGGWFVLTSSPSGTCNTTGGVPAAKSSSVNVTGSGFSGMRAPGSRNTWKPTAVLNWLPSAIGSSSGPGASEPAACGVLPGAVSPGETSPEELSLLQLTKAKLSANSSRAAAPFDVVNVRIR